MLNGNMFDYHFHKMAIFTMFISLVCQMIADVVLGVFFIFFLHYYQDASLHWLHWVTDGLNLSVLKDQTDWLMGLPGGFKPNHNLS